MCGGQCLGHNEKISLVLLWNCSRSEDISWVASFNVAQDAPPPLNVVWVIRYQRPLHRSVHLGSDDPRQMIIPGLNGAGIQIKRVIILLSVWKVRKYGWSRPKTTLADWNGRCSQTNCLVNCNLICRGRGCLLSSSHKLKSALHLVLAYMNFK